MKIRQWFFAAVCFVSLGLSAYGTYTLLSTVLRVYVLTEADRYYSAMKPADDANSIEIMDRNRRATIQRDVAWALPILITNIPICLWSYRRLRLGAEAFADVTAYERTNARLLALETKVG